MDDATGTAANPGKVKTTHNEPRVKETVESILVAFILAFIFRGFVVEAFVIPTGSMAPTLYGAHMRLRCPDCGYTWDVNYSSHGAEDADPPSPAPLAMAYHCPNCGYRFSSADEQRVWFGDRILVLKYAYLFSQPSRWDVVVFKSPHEDHLDPIDPDYSVNYIKRLVGLPGESVVILDGSVYTAKGNVDLSFARDGVTVNNASRFSIQRRPAYAQDRLWRVVNDNDYLPRLDRKDDPMQSPWHPVWSNIGDSQSWLTNDATGQPLRRFSLNSDNGHVQELSFNPDALPDISLLTDYLAYDEGMMSIPRPSVGDLKLSCFYTRQQGDGPLQMVLSKRDDVFTAKIMPGRVALFHGKLRQETPLQVVDNQLVGGTEVPCADLSGSSPAQIELQNVDYRVSLIVNGKTLVQTTDAEYSPNVAALYTAYKNRTSSPVPMIRIAGQNQRCTLDHLKVSRNIYYLNTGGPNQFWANPDKIMHLNSGEYFVLGDNSAISADARWWTDPVKLPAEGMPDVESGRVPEQFMLGKAFFVYWPAGYSIPKTQLNVVPNFGEMRFIH